MTVQELMDNLNVNPEEDVTIRVNGFDKNIEDVPIQNFEIDDILIRLGTHNDCEIVINLGETDC